MKLRPYQEEDVQKLLTLDAAGIFNEQRTGKTPTAVTVVHRAKCSKVLIVCPKSALPIWAEEYTKWTKGRPSYVVDGTRKKKLKTIEQWDKGALIVSYGSLKVTKVAEGLIDIIKLHKPNALIVDEAHRIKDTKSAAFKAVDAFIKTKKRLYLTGTPSPNKQVEIYSLLHSIDPVTFRSAYKFAQEYFKQELVWIKDRQGNAKTISEPSSFLPDKQKEVHEFLEKYTTQRKRKEVMQWLPDKEYIDVKLTPTKNQIKYINELNEFFETGDVVTQGILDRLIRVRQICLEPQLLNLPTKEEGPKTEWIKSYLQDYPNTPVIIFSKFTSYLEWLGDRLTCEFAYITGKVSVAKRKQICDDFQSGKLNVLLINIDAGKEALTLDRGEVTIFTDVFPPASDIQQAEDRFVATDESRANKGHTVYRLMMKGLYDEKLYKLVEKNVSLTDVLNDYKRYTQQ